MPGRHKSGELYRKKSSNRWYFHKPGFGTVDTGTSDRFRAEQVMQNMGGNVRTTETYVANEPPQENVKSALQELADRLPQGQGPDEWRQKVAEVEAQKPASVTPLGVSEPRPATPMATQQAPLAAVGSDVKTAALQNLKKKLSPARREKLIGVMGGGMARVNALAAELALAMSGRKLKSDFVISDDDLEILKTGYEMGLDELLATADPEWWHLVLTGNLVLAVTLLPHIEVKTKAIDVAPPTEDGPNGNGN